MMKEYRIATATTAVTKDWRNSAVTWPVLVKRLGEPKRTKETVSQYKSMDKQAKNAAKDVGGFVGGALIADGPRNAKTIASRSLLTLDIDYGTPSTVGLVDDMLFGTAWCLYSTHSHTAEAPRYRLVIPLSREVTPDEYTPIGRKVAEDIDINLFDTSTYQPERLMYWPSCPVDGDYVFESCEGDPLDVDAYLARYVDWRNIAEWPVGSAETKVIEKRGGKQEDPTLKSGVIGAFCRCYTVTEAIETFLPDIYTQCDIPNRYTYTQGTAAAGMTVYDDKWAFSFHSTDPAAGRLCNAFDLVRIHKFGKLDEDAAPGTPVNRLPSYTAMVNFANSDQNVRGLMAVELVDSFRRDDLKDEGEGKEDNRWKATLELDEKGKHVLPTPYNFATICLHDPALKNTTKYDIFTDRNVLTRDLPWAKITEDHKEWTDNDDCELLIYISENYHLQGKTAIIDSHDAVMARSFFHPVRDYLNARKWDGIERLDTLIIDFLDAVDDQEGLTRAMTRKHFVAAVARIMNPGVKYDQVLALTGPEGAGKSGVIARMGRGWTNASFSPSEIENKSAMESLRGSWLIEMAEMMAYKKSTAEAFKAFISKTNDEYRPAYGRKKVNIKRQCVFFCTTNEAAFLKGDTGNRRFWVIPTLRTKNYVPEGKLDWATDLDDEYVDQVWAEAVTYWRAGEKLYLEGRLLSKATERQELYNEIEEDDRKAAIEAYIASPIPTGWESLTPSQRADYYRGQAGSLADFGEGTKRRSYISVIEVTTELLRRDMNRYEKKEINQMLSRIKGLKAVGPVATSDKVYGCQRRYVITDEFWDYMGNTTK